MSGTDFVGEAAAELYGSDPEGFTERRTALAAQARAAGDRAAAKEIGGLRKPTRSAWMINQLVRADPGVAARLTGLGDQLRAAEAALDGAKIRELSQARRQLMDTLIRQVLHYAGEQSPSAALREDLTATFGAALADPQIARQLATGTLLRAVHRADFGTGAPGLSLVPPLADASGSPASAGPAPAAAPAGGRGDAEVDEAADGAGGTRAAPAGKAAEGTRAAREAKTARGAGATGSARAAAGPKAAGEARAARAAAAALAAEEARAAAEARAAERARAAEERQQAITDAERTLAEASQAAEQAAQAEQDERDRVRALESELDEAHLRVTEARRRVREAQSAVQKARRALERLGPARRNRG